MDDTWRYDEPRLAGCHGSACTPWECWCLVHHDAPPQPHPAAYWDKLLWDCSGRMVAQHRLGVQFNDPTLQEVDMLIGQGHQVVCLTLRHPETGEERTVYIPKEVKRV